MLGKCRMTTSKAWMASKGISRDWPSMASSRANRQTWATHFIATLNTLSLPSPGRVTSISTYSVLDILCQCNTASHISLTIHEISNVNSDLVAFLKSSPSAVLSPWEIYFWWWSFDKTKKMLNCYEQQMMFYKVLRIHLYGNTFSHFTRLTNKSGLTIRNFPPL